MQEKYYYLCDVNYSKPHNHIAMSNILSSVYNLTKTNNGMFKSEKQANFLISQFKAYDDFVGFSPNGKPIFVEYDDKGIIKMYKDLASNKTDIVFERVVEGSLNSVELKTLKWYKSKVKKIQKNLDESIAFAEKKGLSNYSEFELEVYHRSRESDRTRIAELMELIDGLESKTNKLL